jgi:hypothetical protein
MVRFGDEVAGVAPIVPGAPPGHLHWPTTFRTGEPMALRFAGHQLGADGVVVWIDTRRSAHDAASLEMAVSVAAAVGLPILAQRRCLQVVAGTTPVTLWPGSAAELRFLDQLAMVDPLAEAGFAAVREDLSGQRQGDVSGLIASETERFETERFGTEQRGSGQRGSGQRGSGQRGSGQRGSGQRGSGQRGSGQRGSGWIETGAVPRSGLHQRMRTRAGGIREPADLGVAGTRQWLGAAPGAAPWGAGPVPSVVVTTRAGAMSLVALGAQTTVLVVDGAGGVAVAGGGGASSGSGGGGVGGSDGWAYGFRGGAAAGGAAAGSGGGVGTGLSGGATDWMVRP